MANKVQNEDLYMTLPLETREIYSKYMESFYFLQPRKVRQVKQIALLNNLQRGDENIASTLLVTLFNRIMSNLYDDKMQIKFVPSEELDQKKVNSLNILAQNDYREMDKAQLDYDWVWDTLFFGRGYMETLRFDPKKKIMQPHVINPLVFGYDPFFDKPQDWRYYWKWITKSSNDINKLIQAGIIKGITDAKELPSGIDPYLWNYKVIRERAKGATPQANDSYQGDIHQILEYFGYDKDGDKCVYWLDRNFSRVLYCQKLDLKDGDDIVGPGNEVIETKSKWPIVVKEAYREPHASIVFSVADLLEDKHRARSVLLNLAFLAAKDKANPLYVYNPDKVKDVSQLFSRQIYQHIPVDDVVGAIAPLNTDSAMDPSLQAFMQMLNAEASDPVGTNLAPAPNKGNKKTATESAIQQQLSDLAQSLQSKVMQFGEAEFWSHWYCRYRRYTKAGDEKIATIVGVKGMTFEKIDLGEIHTKYPPGVLVFSAKEAEYKEMVLRQDLMQMYPYLMRALDHDGMRNFNKYVFFPKFLDDPTMMDILIPKSLDEIKAEDENDSLAKDTLATVLPTDNHEQHLAIHYMSANTWAKWTHIAWHEELLAQQKQQMMSTGGGGMAPMGMGGSNVKEIMNFKDLPADGQQQMAGMAGISLQPPQGQQGQGQQGPMAAAAPLQGATQGGLQGGIKR